MNLVSGTNTNFEYLLCIADEMINSEERGGDLMKFHLEKINEIFERTVYDLLLYEYSHLNLENDQGNTETEESENPDVLLT